MRSSFRLFGYVAAELTVLAPVPVMGQVPGGTLTSPNPQQPVVVVGQKPKPKLVCESFVPTGSIRRQTSCMSQADADDLRGRSIAELERLKDAQFRLQQLRIARQMMDTTQPR